MSNKPRYIGTRVDEVLHEKIRQYTDRQQVSLSDFVREAVEQMLVEPQTPANGSQQTVSILQTELGARNEEITRLHQEIEQLHQLVGLSQKNVGTISQQLSQAHAQLEDLRVKPTRWWQFWQRPANS